MEGMRGRVGVRQPLAVERMSVLFLSDNCSSQPTPKHTHNSMHLCRCAASVLEDHSGKAAPSGNHLNVAGNA